VAPKEKPTAPTPPPTVSERETKLEQLLRDIAETINGPGRAEEKVINTRLHLTDQAQLLLPTKSS
jgi:hypothetical protein